MLDARVDEPWRRDALERMASLLDHVNAPSVRVGDAGEAPADGAVRTLPGDASLTSIVDAVRALCGPATPPEVQPATAAAPTADDLTVA